LHKAYDMMSTERDGK